MINSITLIIIIINVILFFASQQNANIYSRFVYHPNSMYHDKKQWYRIISGGFLHLDIFHLIFNMMTLYFFGKYVEPMLGSVQFVFFYFLALVVSSLPAYFKHKNNYNYSALGASGAVSAVLYAFIYVAPWSVLQVQFILPVYSIIYGVLFIVISIYLSKRNMDNIGHEAHITGACFGFVYQMLVYPSSIPNFISTILHPPFLQ